MASVFDNPYDSDQEGLPASGRTFMDRFDSRKQKSRCVSAETLDSTRKRSKLLPDPKVAGLPAAVQGSDKKFTKHSNSKEAFSVKGPYVRVAKIFMPKTSLRALKGVKWQLQSDLPVSIASKAPYCRETWDGELDEKCEASGDGTYSFYGSDGSLEWQFSGACQKGHFFGNGIVSSFKKGCLEYDYEGNFLKDKFHGHGIIKIYNPSGELLETYDGDFEQGKRHGSGKCDFEDGSTHDGIWENHRICGEGKWTYRPDCPTGFKHRCALRSVQRVQRGASAPLTAIAPRQERFLQDDSVLRRRPLAHRGA